VPVSYALEVVRYDDARVVLLTAEVQAEYGIRYGGDGDVSPMDAAEFAQPNGLFLLATLGGEPVAMGGWRRGGPLRGDAEVKRMYVRATHRQSGWARRVLAELERTATAAGVLRLVLGTGNKQPEAIALYRSCGYTDIPGFGHYADAPDAVHLAKGMV
jgi:GNAT superfamily N-acetyltransferase